MIMQKLMSNKKIIISICAVAVVIVAAAVILLSNKEEAYRSILVYELDGTAVIERAGVGSMNAAENLYLESGDRVIVAQNSSMRMKLDDDKYVMAEEDTIFTVEAQGTDENSKTKICLEQGAVTNEIQHPLSEGASYETSTPNSVMAVRGTIYRVELYIDENGEQNTKMCCFQGKVATTPVLPGGTSGEEVLVPAGSEMIIHSDGTADSPRDIVYEELPEQAVQNLRSLLESGQSMEGITLEELDILLNQSVDTSEASENNEPEQEVLPDTEENSGQNDSDVDADIDVAENVSEQTDKKAEDSVTPKATTQPEVKPQTPDITTVLPEQILPAPENTQPVVSKPANNDNSGNDNTQDGNISSDSTNNNESNNSRPDDENQNDNRPDDNKPDDNKPDDNKPDDNTPVTPPPTVIYTVTFEYQGEVFATQEVKGGEKASAPLLVPAQDGDWDFEFETVIEANTTIKWKE